MTYLRRVGVGDVWDDFHSAVSGGGADNTSTLDLLMGGPVLDATSAPPADNVNQTSSGTSTSSADFVNIGGVCKPQNFPALASVRAFQAQLNRVAQVKGYGKVATDGAVGPATLALFRKVQSAAGAGTIMGDPSSCMGVAPDVDVLGQQVQAYADSQGAPAQVSSPSGVPTITTKSGAIVVAPDAGIAGSLATLSGVEKLALLGVAGGIAYMLMRKPKPKTTRRK